LHKLTVAIRQTLSTQGPKIIKGIAKDAARGDRQAQALILKLLPRSKVTDAVALDLPALRSAADVPLVLAKISEAMATGLVTPTEASAMANVYNPYGQAHVTAGLQERLEAVEARLRGEAPEAPLNGSWNGNGAVGTA
jgi:hypothetical protein